MTETLFCFGIPSVELDRVGGGRINPADFAGHELVVFFCPADAESAAKEVEAYSQRAAAFVDGGAWLLGIIAKTPDSLSVKQSGSHIMLAWDPDGAAWTAFESLLDPADRGEQKDGGAFFFQRGGCLARAWAGAGHAADALKALNVYRPLPVRASRAGD